MVIAGIEPKGKTKLTFHIQEEEGVQESAFTLSRKKAAALGLPSEFPEGDSRIMTFRESITGNAQEPAAEGISEWITRDAPEEDRNPLYITEAQWQEILSQLRGDALHRCGDLLGRTDYTTASLEKKLETDGYPREIRQQVLMELTDAHYLDDRRLAENYIRGHLGDKSKARIRQDLQQKGISPEDLEEAFASVAEETDMESKQLSQIRRLLEKKHYDPEQATWEEKQKVMAFLYRRGFSQDMIRRGMEMSCKPDM